MDGCIAVADLRSESPIDNIKIAHKKEKNIKISPLTDFGLRRYRVLDIFVTYHSQNKTPVS